MTTNKGSKMTDFEKNCYGMSAAAIRKEYMNSLTARLSGLEMVVMGIMSDCQEMLAMPSPRTLDDARRQMNIAKFILSEMIEAKESV
jgi:hypothetical protein